MSDVRKERGSFRDPNGKVFLVGDRVYRTVMPRAAADFEFVRATNVWQQLLQEGLVLPEVEVDATALGDAAQGAAYVLEHPRLHYVSYPYEWSFPLLKAAALLHLDIQLRALEDGVSLTDATAYNIQFQGPEPVFIDHLSFKRYSDGEYWFGHRQFCEQFLNPLLLRAKLGVPHNAWYRGAQEGIAVTEINRLIPLRKKLSWQSFSNVLLQARLQESRIEDKEKQVASSKRRFPLTAYRHLLAGLRAWIGKLEPADTGRTVWGEYATTHSYTDEEVQQKRTFVHNFVQSKKIETLWDIGCNTGDYAKVAVEAGASRVIGFDFDQKALELAYARSRSEQLPILPLFLDAANPSPNQGWAQSERMGFTSRQAPDGIIALALVHHLAIAKNIPLEDVVDWLVGLSRSGVIEFVPKDDPMVQALLRMREDIFDDYHEDRFVQVLQNRARIVQSQVVSSSGRRLHWFER